MNPAATSARPVSWDETLGAYRVTGFTEASQVLRGEGWSSDPRRSPLVAPDVQDLPPGNLLFTDPPDHTRLRRLVSPAFRLTSIGQLQPRVAAIVDAVLDGLEQTGDEIDILADVGYPVALAVIAELLDVGIEGAQLFAEHTPDLMRLLEINATDEDLMASAVASTELMLFLTPILSHRARHPGQDFISALLALQDQPDGLTLNEVLATCMLLLVAGHETTANLIANATLALIEHPDQRPHLHTDPGRAIEELLRLEGPVRLLGRTATTDHHLGDQHIATGQAVLVDVWQANRDSARFPDPGRLDLTRQPTGHVGFGIGPHFCLGAALARLEATETLTRLWRRLPHLTLAGPPPRRRDSTAFHGLHDLWVIAPPTGDGTPARARLANQST